MAKKTQRGGAKASSNRDLGPTQRQLRAAEVVRHALVDVLARGELRDPELVGVSITVGEVRASPDLKHMNVFVAPLGLGDAKRLAAALNKSASFLRGRLGKEIELRFTPELNFLADVSFDEANYIDQLLESPEVRRDLTPHPLAGEVPSEARGRGETSSSPLSQPAADCSPASRGAVKGEDQ